MIGDSILPGNEGREYVLRRIIRRAARHGRLLGIEGPFLADLCERVIEVSGKAYPELVERSTMIKKVIAVEEAKFAATIDQGMKIIVGYMDELKADGSKVLEGEKAFKLHDTYGFPIDLTREILEESGYTVDIDGFNAAMLEQKKRSQAEQTMEDTGWDEASAELKLEGQTQFTGYETLSDTATIKLISGNKLVLDKTPFYAESGGQAGDTGYIMGAKGKAKVLDVTKTNNIFVHKIELEEGTLSEGEEVQCQVAVSERNMTAANHTATHLMHKALQETLGEHVKQAGSSVTKDGLRFDFNHFQPMSREEIQAVENRVNDKISQFIDVNTQVMAIDDAFADGATGLFGEKYGDTVRVVSVGDYSKELCGGTHIKNSGQIGAFKILSESGVASGVRRIEAVTGQGVLAKYREDEAIIENTASALKSSKDNISERSVSLMEEVKSLKKELEDLKKAELNKGLGSLIDEAKDINGIKLITKEFEDYNINDLRGLSDTIKAENKGVAMVFATVSDGKVTFLVSLTDDLVEAGRHAGKMIKEIAAAAGGGGGGKADMAQAGAKDPSKVADAFAKAEELLQ
jgi:alanyl-tRNA synthetase